MIQPRLNTLSNKCSHDLSHLLNNELDKEYMWLCTNKLSLNIEKTKFMIFHNPGKHLGIIPNIIIKNTLIERVHNFNFLGININENLSWVPQNIC